MQGYQLPNTPEGCVSEIRALQIQFRITQDMMFLSGNDDNDLCNIQLQLEHVKFHRNVLLGKYKGREHEL
jgi:hypothetical protein